VVAAEELDAVAGGVRTEAGDDGPRLVFFGGGENRVRAAEQGVGGSSVLALDAGGQRVERPVEEEGRIDE